MRVFLEHSPDSVKVTDGKGDTLFHTVVAYTNWHEITDLLRLLVEFWPEGREAVNRHGLTPLQHFEQLYPVNHEYFVDNEKMWREIIALLGGMS
jgi:hypothetical protein